MRFEDLRASLTGRMAEGDEWPAPAGARAVEHAETQLGHALHSLHARLLSEVANGGLGPGVMYGVQVASATEDADDLVGAYRLLADELPAGAVPFADLSGGCWLLVDCASARLMATDETGTFETSHDLSAGPGR